MQGVVVEARLAAVDADKPGVLGDSEPAERRATTLVIGLGQGQKRGPAGVAAVDLGVLRGVADELEVARGVDGHPGPAGERGKRVVRDRRRHDGEVPPPVPQHLHVGGPVAPADEHRPARGRAKPDETLLHVAVGIQRKVSDVLGETQLPNSYVRSPQQGSEHEGERQEDHVGQRPAQHDLPEEQALLPARLPPLLHQIKLFHQINLTTASRA